VIVAACSPEEQLRRTIARDHLSPEEASARLTAQLPIDEKVRRANHVIWTAGSFDETERQIEKLVEVLKQ
jgi:dephospho-CoA kinase